MEVEGAPCAVPGATGDCPGGQACGNDLRCSARALACAASRCSPGTGDCLDPQGAASGTAQAHWCSDRDPVCGTPVVEPCADRGLVCGRRSGAPRCECPVPPAPARSLAVNPDGGFADALPYATGASAPPACTFRTLTAALERARELRTLDPSAPVTVTAQTGGAARIFSGASGERFPLAVRQGVTLRSDAQAAGGSAELLFDAGASASVALYLNAGSALERFTIRNGDGEARHRLLHVECQNQRPTVRLSAVTVEGRGAGGSQVGTGLQWSGPCAVEADALQVRSAAVGMLLDPSFDTTERFAITGGSVTGCAGAGVVFTGGALVLDRVRIEGNGGRGLQAGADFYPAANVEVRDSSIVGNGDGGLSAWNLGELRVTGTTLFGNGATTDWAGPLSTTTVRRAGGVVLTGRPPAALQLQGNRIYANRGDQLLVLGPDEAVTWALGPASCGSDPAATNMLGCWDTAPAPAGPSYRGLVVVDASASAQNEWWAPTGGGPAAPSADDVAQLPSGQAIPVGTTCAWTSPRLDCSSEEPVP